MPILDWTRTNLAYELPNKAKALRFEKDAIVAFDVFILKRPNAEKDYSEGEIKLAAAYLEGLDESEKELIITNIIKGLPGSEEGYTLEQFQAALDTYDGIGRKELEENLRLFLSEVVPIAEESKVYLAIHPDDPPFNIFGLPRVMSTSKDVRRLISDNPSPYNGITFCTITRTIRHSIQKSS